MAEVTYKDPIPGDVVHVVSSLRYLYRVDDFDEIDYNAFTRSNEPCLVLAVARANTGVLSPKPNIALLLTSRGMLGWCNFAWLFHYFEMRRAQ